MRRQDESKKSVILDFIDEYYNEYNEIPAVRLICLPSKKMIASPRMADAKSKR